MVGYAVMQVGSIACWFFFAICFNGCDWDFNSTHDKKDRKVFKEHYDVKAINKYLGKTLFLPLAVLLTYGSIFFIFCRQELLVDTALKIAALILCVAVVAILVRGFHLVCTNYENKFKLKN